MKKIFLFASFFVLFVTATAQVATKDNRYLEDQFYMGVTYNLLLSKPEGAEQRNLPYGLQLGYIKDIPLNESRNIGLGIGLGYAVNTYYTNILATEDINRDVIYSLNTDVEFKRSKIETHLIELPLEFRWRTSTADEYKFWRVYAGAKLGYVFGARSKFVTEGSKTSFSNVDIKDVHYGLTFSFGYNTWNIHMYYQLNKLFNDGVVIGDSLDRINVRPLRIGVVFYIL